jgi:hypothetical protein
MRALSCACRTRPDQVTAPEFGDWYQWKAAIASESKGKSTREQLEIWGRAQQALGFEGEWVLSP